MISPARRRELAEKWASKVIDPLAFPQFLESAFLELEREVRESVFRECIDYLNGSTFERGEMQTVNNCIALLKSLKDQNAP